MKMVRKKEEENQENLRDKSKTQKGVGGVNFGILQGKKSLWGVIWFSDRILDLRNIVDLEARKCKKIFKIFLTLVFFFYIGNVALV